MRYKFGILCPLIISIVSQSYAQGVFGDLLKEAKIEETSTKKDSLLLNLVKNVEENEKSERQSNERLGGRPGKPPKCDDGSRPTCSERWAGRASSR